MEFSASFPVDLSHLADGLPAADGATPAGSPPGGKGFAGVMAEQAGVDAAEADGESLPHGGEALPPAIAPTLLPPVAAILPALPLTAPAAQLTDAPLDTADLLLPEDSATPLSPLPAAISAALRTPAPPAADADPALAVAANPAATDGAAAADAAVEVTAPLPEATLHPAEADESVPVDTRPLPDVPVDSADPDAEVSVEAASLSPDADTPDGDTDPDRLPHRPQHAQAAAPGRADLAAAAQASPQIDAGNVTDETLVIDTAGGQRAAQAPLPSANAPADTDAAPMRQFDLDPGADVDQLATRIRWLADSRIGEARIRMNPPELGALDIRLSVVDDETFVHISAQGAGTRELLEGSIPKLRALLVAGGLSLGGASVDSGQRGTPEQAFRGDEPAVPMPLAFTAREEVRSRHALDPTGQVDLYA